MVEYNYMIDMISSETSGEIMNYPYYEIVRNEDLSWDGNFIRGSYICNVNKEMPLFHACMKDSVIEILSPYDGICVFQGADEFKLKERISIRFYSCMAEFLKFCFPRYLVYQIEEDEFDGEKIIKWGYVNEEVDNILYDDDDENLNIEETKWENRIADCKGLSINYNDVNDHFLFGIDANSKGMFFNFTFPSYLVDVKIGDKLILLLEEKTKLVFNVTDKPIEDGSECRCSFLLNKSMLDLLESKCILAWKIDFIDGSPSYVSNSSSCCFYKAAIFREWVKRNLQLFKICGYQVSDSVNETRREGTCYVYLMHDLANGYYKIGISNNPEYRERTLQSEKPTIELIIAKEFPVRRIAEAFESALHKAYEAQRIRGEWFHLESEDVENLIISLS